MQADYATIGAELKAFRRSLGCVSAVAYCLGSNKLLAHLSIDIKDVSCGAVSHALKLQGALQHSMRCSRPCEVRVFLVEGTKNTELTLNPSCALHSAHASINYDDDDTKVPKQTAQAWQRLCDLVARVASQRKRASQPLDPLCRLEVQNRRIQRTLSHYNQEPEAWRFPNLLYMNDEQHVVGPLPIDDVVDELSGSLPIVLNVTRYSPASVALGDLKAALKHNVRTFGDVNGDGEMIGGGMAALFDERVFDHRLVIMEAIKNHGTALLFASPRLRADKAVVLAAVTKNGCALLAASSALREDVDVVSAAVASEGVALEFASPKMQDNEDVVATAINAPVAVRRCAGVSPLKFASPRLKDNYATVRAAVDKLPEALAHASTNLKANRELVLAAVEKHGNALQHAAACLKSDGSIVLAAIAQSGDSLQHASEDLQHDRDVFLAAVRSVCKPMMAPLLQLTWLRTALSNTPAHVRGDKDVVFAAAKFLPQVVQGTPFASDRAAMVELVHENFMVLSYAAQELKADKHIALTALKKNCSALNFVDSTLRDDELFMRAAASYNGWALNFASERLRNHRGLVIDAVTQDGNALLHASTELRKDKEVVLAALNNTPAALMYVDPALIGDCAILQAAALSALKSANRNGSRPTTNLITAPSDDKSSAASSAASSAVSSAASSAVSSAASSAESSAKSSAASSAESSAASSAESSAASSSNLSAGEHGLHNTLSLLFGGVSPLDAMGYLSQFFHIQQ